MFTDQYLNQHLTNKLFSLSRPDIIAISKDVPDGGINNVLTGLYDDCFGFFMNDEITLDYSIFFVGRRNRHISGSLIELNLLDPERNNLLRYFSKIIADEYDLDPLDTFNTFQLKTRTICENYGYFTVGSQEIEEFKGQELVFFTPNHKGVILLPFYSHKDFYRLIFGELPPIKKTPGVNYIYLMFNARNRFIKIGKSIHPRHREKTLQAEEPEIYIIAVWKAEGIIEKELHKSLKIKRKRGEWFKLTIAELVSIKEHMDKLTHVT